MRNPRQPSTTPPTASSRERATAERQLSALYGESLFGPWPELGAGIGGSGRIPRRKRWVWSLLAVLALVGLVAGIRSLVAPALERATHEDSRLFAEQLAQFLDTGDMARAAQFADLARGARATLDPHSPQLELRVRAEATLYRYFDADPRRLQRLEPFLGAALGPRSAPTRRMASLTLLSNEARTARVADIESVLDEYSDTEVLYLLAAALEGKGDVPAARESWKRSEDLGPGWLPLRFEQARFEARRGGAAAAKAIAERMMRTHPESGWSRLAVERFGGEVVPPPGDAGTAVSSPLLVYREKLDEAVDLAKHDESKRARAAVAEALDAVHGQAPFVLDAFDELVLRGAVGLARAMTRKPPWPVESPLAAEKVRRLSEARETP